MATRNTRRRATDAVAVLAIVALVTATAAACGSSAAPPASLAPADAAAALARNLDLNDRQTTCMRQQFEQAPSAAAVLDTDEPAGDADRDRFLVAIRTCLPPEDLGTTLAATVLAELPEATIEQSTCVHDNVVALSGAEQDRLYLYFSNPATLDVADVGQAGTDLLASCDLATGDEPPGTDPAPTIVTTTMPPR